MCNMYTFCSGSTTVRRKHAVLRYVFIFCILTCAYLMANWSIPIYYNLLWFYSS